MRIPSRLQKLIIDALSHSMSVHTMVKIVNRINNSYDLYKRSGFPRNIPIPNIDAAKQITKDLVADGLLIKFVEKLIDVYENGLMGRKIKIRFLPQIIRGLESLGFFYDDKYGMFIERSEGKKTKGWGILLEGHIYELTFMNIDIVNNTELVRKYSRNEISQAYFDLREIFKFYVERRNGRIWNWEGDGGLAAFYLEDKNINAILCGIDIISELFLYNLFRCNLKESLKIRLAVHTGPCQFAYNIQTIQSDTLRKIEELETKYTIPDSLTISPGVYSDMGSKLEYFFTAIPIAGGNYIYRYTLKWEE